MKFIKYLTATLLLTFVLIAGNFLNIVTYGGGIFHSSYQSEIQVKAHRVQQINEPKIILVAGSSAAFGLDQYMLEEATGYKVVNMGLHAGFGATFPSELAKANINPGDIVLFGYEYTNSFSDFGTDLIMSGIDNDLSLYQYVPVKNWPNLLGYAFTYAYKVNTYRDSSGIYSRESFDANDQMICNRSYFMNFYDVATYGSVDIGDPAIDDTAVQYLCSFKQYIEDHGASVYFVSPPVLEDSLTCTLDDLERFKQEEISKIGVPYICDPADYVFPSTLMFNSIYHCNSRGEAVRTKLLIRDLYNAGVVQPTGAVDCTLDQNDALLFESNPASYLNKVENSRYTLLLSTRSSTVLNHELCTALQARGLTPDAIQNSLSYCAIVTPDSVQEEFGTPVSQAAGILPGSNVPYYIESIASDVENKSSLQINDEEYSWNEDGLNLLLWDNDEQTIVDVFSVDADGVIHR